MVLGFVFFKAGQKNESMNSHPAHFSEWLDMKTGPYTGLRYGHTLVHPSVYTHPICQSDKAGVRECLSRGVDGIPQQNRNSWARAQAQSRGGISDKEQWAHSPLCRRQDGRTAVHNSCSGRQGSAGRGLITATNALISLYWESVIGDSKEITSQATSKRALLKKK